MHHHAAGLRRLLAVAGVAVDAQSALIDGLLAADLAAGLALTPRERALVAYADKLTVGPSTVARADIENLRAVGLSDLAIHDACAIVAYFAFVNRIADGLGVELERGSNE
ncbi:MAG: hypothetical protein ABIP94_24680 [Planctomycetota bacterium]